MSPIVALGEVHGNEQCQQFRLALLRDRRVTDLVNDVVVEFGNAKYQDVVDSFVAGGNVADAELRHVWQDTTQISGVWDRAMYGDFFRAVRDLNLSLPQNRRLRVLLGDPPVDWELMRRINEGPANEREGKVRINGMWVARENAQSLDRDAYAADVVRREVLAKGRRALLLFGEMHVRRLGRTVVSRIETSTGTRVFSIVNATGTNYDALRTLFPDTQSWPVPRAVLTPSNAFSSGPFSESDAVPLSRSSERPDRIQASRRAVLGCRLHEDAAGTHAVGRHARKHGRAAADARLPKIGHRLAFAHRRKRDLLVQPRPTG